MCTIPQSNAEDHSVQDDMKCTTLNEINSMLIQNANKTNKIAHAFRHLYPTWTIYSDKHTHCHFPSKPALPWLPRWFSSSSCSEREALGINGSFTGQMLLLSPNQQWRELKALTSTKANHMLDLSFPDIPTDYWRKGTSNSRYTTIANASIINVHTTYS